MKGNVSMATISLVPGRNVPDKVIKTNILKTVNLLCWVSFAIFLGFIGLFMLYPGTSAFVQLPALAFVYFSGIGIGYFNPRIWIISGLVGWGGTVLAIISILGHVVPVSEIAVLLISSVGLSLFGGLLGKQSRQQHRLSARKWTRHSGD
jgi:hypothetical protein